MKSIEEEKNKHKDKFGRTKEEAERDARDKAARDEVEKRYKEQKAEKDKERKERDKAEKAAEKAAEVKAKAASKKSSSKPGDTDKKPAAPSQAAAVASPRSEPEKKAAVTGADAAGKADKADKKQADKADKDKKRKAVEDKKKSETKTAEDAKKPSKDESKKKAEDTKKAPAKKKEHKDSSEELVLGPFSLTPASGEVPAGGSVFIDVTMDAKSTAVFLELIEISISDRDTKRQPRLLYELSGEGCTPGIDCEGFEAIFEEQELHPRLDRGASSMHKNFFALEERVFTFAPVIAASSLPETTATTAASASGDGLTARRPGLTERFRISNPFKIPCDVQLQIVPLGEETPR